MIEIRTAVAPARIDEVAVDLAVVGLFGDERPLRGASGRADWRLCGTLSRLVQAGRLRGTPGEAALLPGGGGLRADQVLVVGLGARADFDRARSDDVLRGALERVRGLRARSVALAWPALASEDRAPEIRVARWLSVLGATLGDGPDSELEIRWVVGSEERPGIQEALRRALIQPRAGSVRVRLAEAAGEPGRRPAASPRAAAPSPGLRVK